MFRCLDQRSSGRKLLLIINVQAWDVYMEVISSVALVLAFAPIPNVTTDFKIV